MTSHSIVNLLPWGGPTARAIAVMGVETNDVMRGLVPMMVAGLIYMFIIAWILVYKNGTRLVWSTCLNKKCRP